MEIAEFVMGADAGVSVSYGHISSFHSPKAYCRTSVVPRSRFLGDTGAPLPEFQMDICNIWGTHQIRLIFTCKIENSFPEISVHFYLNLSSMSIVLAQEVVQITVK